MDAPNDLPVHRQRALDEVRATLARLGVDSADVDLKAHLVDDLDLDSLDWVDLSMQLEETLSITLEEERFVTLRTVEDVVDLVHAALLEAHGPRLRP